MLKKDFLKTIKGLDTLTDDQLTAIENASKADEDNVIGLKVKEIHDRYDEDVKGITGNAKPGGMKSYDHISSELKRLKGIADNAGDTTALNTEITNLKSERDSLKAKIESGSTDQVLKDELASVKVKLSDKETELSKVKTDFENEKTSLQSKLKTQKETNTSLIVGTSIDAYRNEKKLKFNADLEKGGVVDRLLNIERKEFLNSVTPDYREDGKGGQELVFRNEKGEILFNKNNHHKPYTAGELFYEREGVKGLLAEDRKQGGAGTSGGAGGSGGGVPSNLDLSGAKTQVEADTAIRNHIMTNEGISKTDAKFGERHKEIREEHKVSELDVR